MTALMRAAGAGDTPAVRKLLDRPRPFRPRVDRAVRPDDLRDLIAFLSWMQERPERRDGWTALHFAAHAHRTGAARLLLEAGADPNRLERGGESALDVAVPVLGPSTYPPMAHLLLDHGARAGDSRGGGRGLLVAASVGDTALVRRLVGAGYPVDGSATQDRTSLMVAASRGDSATVELLLGLGADPERRDREGATAGILALRAGEGRLARRLGAGQTSDGRAVQAMEAVLSDDVVRLRRVLSGGAVADLRDPHGRGLLQLAADTASEEVALALLDAMEVPDGREGERLMNVFIRRRHTAALDRLLDAGVPLPERAASSAVLSGDPDLLRQVLDGGADPAHGPNWPLFYALGELDPVIFEILLEAGADPHEPFHNGLIPLDVAEQISSSCPRCSELLRTAAGSDVPSSPVDGSR